MKILVISPFVYGHSAGHGGASVCISQITSLARSHEIHFLAFASPDEDDSTKKCLVELHALCVSVTVVPLVTGRINREWSRIRHLVYGFPLGAMMVKSQAMKEKIAQALNDICPDVALIQFPQMAQYVGSCATVPTVLDVHDAQSVSSYRLFKVQSSLLRKAEMLLNWLYWVRYEARFYQSFDKIISLTDQDRYGLGIFSPSLHIDVIPVALDVEAIIPNRLNIVKNSITFIGSFSHPPNENAVSFFLEEIFPLVLESIPDAHFQIAGRGAKRLFGRYESDNVTVLGFVEDLQHLYQSSTVVVLPLRFGGGIKIKAVEAMAYGCPIVSTDIGIEETSAVDNVHALIANSPYEFAEKLVGLLQDESAQERLSENARALAVSKFTLEVRNQRLEHLFALVRDKVPQNDFKVPEVE